MTLQRHRVTQLPVRGRTKSRSSTSSHTHARWPPGGRQARTGQGRHPMPPPAERSNGPRRCGAQREGMKNRPLQAEEGRTGVKHQQTDRRPRHIRFKHRYEGYTGQWLGRGRLCVVSWSALFSPISFPRLLRAVGLQLVLFSVVMLHFDSKA